MTPSNHHCIPGTLVLSLASLGHRLPLLPEVGANLPAPSCQLFQHPLGPNPACCDPAHVCSPGSQQWRGQWPTLLTSCLTPRTPAVSKEISRNSKVFQPPRRRGAGVGRSIISSEKNHREQGLTCFSLQSTK